jgi:cobalt/nickel transport system permease protein
MIRTMDAWANINHWHDRVIENWLLSGGLLMLALILPPLPSGPLILAVSVAATTLGARVPLRVVIRAMAAPSAFLFFSVIPILLSFHSTANSSAPFGSSRSGIPMAAETVFRSLGAISALILLGVTTPAFSQIGLFRRLHIPRALLDLMVLSYRLLFLLDGIIGNMISAQTGRLGYRNLRSGFRSGSLAIAGLLTRAMTRAQIMERGLAARGYNGDLRVLDISRRADPKRLALIMLAHGLIAAVSLSWRSLRYG